MDRRSFLASVAAALGANRLTPAAPTAQVYAPTPVPPRTAPLRFDDIGMEGLRALASRLGSTPRLYYLSNQKDLSAGWRLGDTLPFRRLGAFLPDAPIMSRAETGGHVALTNFPDVVFFVPRADLDRPIQKFRARYLEPAMATLANEIQKSIDDAGEGAMLVTAELPLPEAPSDPQLIGMGVPFSGRWAGEGVTMRTLAEDDPIQGGWWFRFDVLYGILTA